MQPKRDESDRYCRSHLNLLEMGLLWWRLNWPAQISFLISCKKTKPKFSLSHTSLFTLSLKLKPSHSHAPFHLRSNPNGFFVQLAETV
ncbi:hypothetical protein P8452_69471 [Trifolium repens]|nr:hypothetical protein P8452_69471 [Trifolium repens]